MPKTTATDREMAVYFVIMDERLRKWRLILGDQETDGADSGLSEEEAGMDAVLEALYDSDRQGSLGSSSPNVNRWLGDIRTYFPRSMVQLMQRDALDRLGLKQLLLEPEVLEQLEPDAELVATLLQLKEVIPDRTRESARELVRRLAQRIAEKLGSPLQKSVRGALQRSERIRNPRLREIDWHLTIRKNLRHYQPRQKTIIPEIVLGNSRKRKSLRDLYILTDQSGSMAGSLVYAGIMASVMAHLPAINTRFFVFDTHLADLSDLLDDPVELLFGVQLGGGTDIAGSLHTVAKQIERPRDTILLLISDLYEGGKEEVLLAEAARLADRGVRTISLLALNDQGAPAYNKTLANRLARLGIPAFACTPDVFPEFIAAAIEGKDNWPEGPGLFRKS